MKYLRRFNEKLDTSNMHKDIFNIWYILCDIMDDGYDVFNVSPSSLIQFNKYLSTSTPDTGLLLHYQNKSVDTGHPHKGARHGTTPDFFEYTFKNKVNNKSGFIITILPGYSEETDNMEIDGEKVEFKKRKVFNIQSISDSLLQIKSILEYNSNLKCEFYHRVFLYRKNPLKGEPIDLESFDRDLDRISMVIRQR